MHGPVLTEFRTTDPQRAHALIAKAYSDNRLRVSGSPQDFRFSQRRVDLGPVQLDMLHNTMTTKYTMHPLERLVVSRTLSRTMDVEVGRSHQRVGVGDVILIAPPDQPYRTCVHGASLQLIGVDLALLDALTEGEDEPASVRVSRFVRTPLSPGAALSWQRTVDFVTELAERDDEASRSPLVLGAAGRLLAATLLAVFDPAAVNPSGATTGDVSTATTRRAIDYMESNPDLDLGVTDIARAASVSVRTLQLAFRKDLNTTPMAHLRRVRLDRVHAELAQSVPDGTTTVTSVAARWGFLNSSRFTAHYRRVYGVLPSETLRA